MSDVNEYFNWLPFALDGCYPLDSQATVALPGSYLRLRLPFPCFFNTIGFYFNFWNMKPYIQANEAIAGMPFDFGIYPVISSFMVYTISRVSIHPIYIIILFSLLTTLFEYIVFLLKIVSYDNNWTIGWTFISYLLAYIYIAIYAKLLSKFINPLLQISKKWEVVK